MYNFLPNKLTDSNAHGHIFAFRSIKSTCFVLQFTQFIKTCDKD